MSKITGINKTEVNSNRSEIIKLSEKLQYTPESVSAFKTFLDVIDSMQVRLLCLHDLLLEGVIEEEVVVTERKVTPIADLIT